MKEHIEVIIGIAVCLIGLWLWKAPSRSQLWRWIADRVEVTAQTAEYRERLQQGKQVTRALMEVER